MRKEIINTLIKSRMLRARQIDKERIKSLLKSAEINAAFVKKLEITDENATLVLREIYESIRQLGEAYWWLLGYEPLNHEISLEILKEMEIRDKIKLNFLGRFKQIRHDANYRGFRVLISQAKEILDFWNSCSKDFIKIINKQL